MFASTNVWLRASLLHIASGPPREQDQNKLPIFTSSITAIVSIRLATRFARQNYGIRITAVTIYPILSTNPVLWLNNNGIATTPGNSVQIIDFMSEALFGGNLTASERQLAITYLDSDDLENPSPYNDDRIRQLAALLLGYQRFQEQ